MHQDSGLIYFQKIAFLISFLYCLQEIKRLLKPIFLKKGEKAFNLFVYLFFR